jgi:hypothetical protein
VDEKVYGIEYMGCSQLVNELADWNGRRALELMSLQLPKEGEVESADQIADHCRGLLTEKLQLQACPWNDFEVRSRDFGLVVESRQRI